MGLRATSLPCTIQWALERQEFYYVRQCIALSILYGGPGPNFFGETAANYMLDLKITQIPNEDIPDALITEKIQQVYYHTP